MKAVVWHDVGKISVDEVPMPRIQDPADAIVRITTSAICGTDHRKYIPGLLSKIAAGQADPATVWTQQQTIPGAIEAYQAFDRRDPGWTKVTLEVA